MKIDRVMKTLEKMLEPFDKPLIDAMDKDARNPFRVLIATLLSLRTKDEVTGKAAARLFAAADTPEALLAVDESLVRRLIYPVGFYKTKAKNIHRICRRLIDEFGGRVPDDMDSLLALPGVGRKTANLVLSLGYGIPAICVDTHVHRISNRWGFVKTKSPEETELRLRKLLPKRHWIKCNRLLVTLGQNLCKPVSPLCSRCDLSRGWCKRVGVERSR